MKINAIEMSRFAATVAAIAGFEAPKESEPPIDWLVCLFAQYCREPIDRVFIYNSDCVPMYMFDKYPGIFEPVLRNTLVSVPMHSAIPAVTPVNFATMYTGAQPSVHGIKAYVKPVVKTDTLFDSARRSGKKVALFTLYDVGTMTNIFKERDMDYYLCNSDSEAEAETRRLIDEDDYDFISSYGMDYDLIQHRRGPESAWAMTVLQQQTDRFARLVEHVKEKWTSHNTLIIFTSDHGNHPVHTENKLGDHGELGDLAEDVNVMHFWGMVKKSKSLPYLML